MPVLSYTMYEFLNGSNRQFVDGLNLTIDFFDPLGYFFGYPFHHPYEILVLKVLDQHNGKLETTFRQEYVEIHVEYIKCFISKKILQEQHKAFSLSKSLFYTKSAIYRHPSSCLMLIF